MDLLLQGQIFKTNAKFFSFERKLTHWLDCVEKADNGLLSHYKKMFLNENYKELKNKYIYTIIQAHSEAFKDSFEHYFPTA